MQRNRTFLRAGPDGSIDAAALGDTGLFHSGTRFLSRLELRVAGAAPKLLDAGVDDDNLTLIVDLTTPNLQVATGLIPADTIHLRRTLMLTDAALIERLEVANYGREPAELDLSYLLEADFADLFEARGMRRARRGTLLPPEINGESLHLTYEGLDEIRRRTSASPGPEAAITSDGIRLRLKFAPGERRTCELSIRCMLDSEPVDLPSFQVLSADRRDELSRWRRGAARITTSNPYFNAWLDRSAADLEMLTIATEHGPYPAAGAPWYVTTFGRDGIITALQLLDVDPRIAAGVLRFLAAHQATAVDAATDAAPGKIVHEMRDGEMADLGEHHFGRYYGTIDATPLFLMLAGAYFRRTADLDLMREIWPNVLAALEWIESYGDVDDDGFVEYRSNPVGGLIHQGWKDSHNSVIHADGSDAHAPIALCEVQGYVYAGKLAAAAIAAALGASGRASVLREQADHLRQEFQRTFWDDDLGSFVLALDGEKRPCRIITTNAGHCLYTGIARNEQAARLADTFSQPDMSSGWGLRTLSASAARYNPLAYHNGSIWPHDNAIVAAGLARYGFSDTAAALLNDTYAAAMRTPAMRLPELYCGFQRQPGRDPVRYPISCTPQAWAAGSVFMLLSAILGITLDATTREVSFTNPHLPRDVASVTIEGLHISASICDLTLRQIGDSVDVDLRQIEGDPISLRVSAD